jgi:hypothetical protein
MLIRFLLQVSVGAALVLLFEHLVGQGVKPRGPVERNFLSYAQEFAKQLQQLLQQQPGASKIGDLLEKSEPVREPLHRTARVNLLLTNVAAVKEQLMAPSHAWASQFQEPTLKESIVLDEHLPDVFSLPARVLTHDHPLVENGHIVLQVLSAHLLHFPLLGLCCVIRAIKCLEVLKREQITVQTYHENLS